MTIYLLPATQQSCVSYTYSSDLLHIYSHLKDKFTKISVKGSEYFDVAPMILQQGLNILNPKQRFKITDVNFAKIWLQGTKIVGDEIHLTPFRRVISNIHSNYNVCWNDNFNGVRTMRSMMHNFFGTPFNGDLCDSEPTMENCKETRRDVTKQNFQKSTHKLISKDANALYLLYNSDDIASFFKMSAAGFEPLPENNNIMMIPLKETILTYNGSDHHGFLTPLDSCRKKWFILPNGKIVGQYNHSIMSIREPEFAPIVSRQMSYSSEGYVYVDDEDEEDENED